MISRTRLALLSSVLFLAACEAPVEPTRRLSPNADRSYAPRTSTAVVTRPHFYFLRPLGTTDDLPLASSFDGTLPAVVTVCHVTAGSCDATVATLSTTGSPLQRIYVNDRFQQYVGVWATETSHLTPGAEYRLAVTVGGTTLGTVALKAIGDDDDVRVDLTKYLPVSAHQMVPIRFRIEKGAVSYVDPAKASTAASADGAATIAFPAGAVTSPIGVTIDPAAIDVAQPANVNAVAGSAVTLGPDGTQFAKPVTVTLRYDPAKLPPGFIDRALHLATLVNGTWQQISGSIVDPVTHTVTGSTTHFSVYGVVAFQTFTQLAIGDAETAGAAFACGLTPGNDVYCWGENQVDNLGSPSTSTCGPKTLPCTLKPALVQGGIKFNFIAAGGSHACGISLAGDAYCWGGAGAGQLGDGTNTPQSSPTKVAGNLKWKSLAAGERETCGVTTNGTAYCWGGNYYGQLGTASPVTACPNGGTSTTPCTLTPTPVAINAPVSELSVGLSFACAIDTKGSAWCWGGNVYGNLGDGTTAPHRTPGRVASNLTFKHISAGTASACAVTTANVGYCWGRNDGIRSLGIGDGPNSFVPVPVSGALAMQSISAANANNIFAHTCALTTDASVWCWGGNSAQQLGSTSSNETCYVANYLGTVFSSSCNNVPELASAGHTFRSVVTGLELTCGVATDGQAYCWGNDKYGQIGDGTTSNNRSATVVPVA